jgi:NADH-quinone oxidoreductase subunit N
MAGFLSKLFIFIAAWQQGSALTWLVIIGLINSVISIAYYANVVWRMFVVEPVKQDRLATPPAVAFTVALSVIGIFVVTILFGPLINQIGQGAMSLFAQLGH